MSQTKLRVLIVDDEPAIRRALRPSFLELGFGWAEAARGEEGLQQLRAATFDAVLLDLNMPGIGGLETLRRIRLFAPRLPVLMLTVRDAEEEKVRALEMGADDYITKPFGTRELVARIRAAVRSHTAPEIPQDTALTVGEITLNPATRDVMRRGEVVRLTRKEFDILNCLMRNAGKVVTYSRLLSIVWGEDYRDQTEYLRTYIRLLRKKVCEDPARPRYLQTEPYIGYRFADEAALAHGIATEQVNLR